MRAILDVDAQAVANAARSDGISPILKCVRIGGGEIVAADGFMLARRPVKTDGEGFVLVPAKSLREARCGEVIVEQAESGGQITIQGGETIVIDPPEGFFPPDLEVLYPQSPSKAYVALSIKLLKKLLSSLGGEASFIKLRIRGRHEAVEFVAGEASGLIMPMSFTEEDGHWHTQVEKHGEEKTS